MRPDHVKAHLWFALSFFLISFLHPALAQSASRSTLHKTDQALQARVSEVYGRLPLSFERNQGQTDSEVKFLARGKGYTLFLTPTEAVLALRQASVAESQKHKSPFDARARVADNRTVSSAVLRLKLEGANPTLEIVGREELPAKSNYFIGNEPARWHTNVAQFAQVEYREVYPGVSLIYYGNQGQLEYDFVVSPGADPEKIRLVIEGAEKAGQEVSLRVNPQSDLVLTTQAGEMYLHKPFIYQEREGIREEIPGRYVLLDQKNVGFEVGRYDPTRTLVIDPILTYSTYLGVGPDDAAFGIAVDASGNAYITGFTGSSNFPTTANAFQSNFGGGYSDAFVTKLDTARSGAASLVYSTYLGGSSIEAGVSIAVDASGNAYITGNTTSTNFPTTANALQNTLRGGRDAFLTKIDMTEAGAASLVYSTYLGGSSEDGGAGIVVDASGNAYITGRTDSPDFPTTANASESAFGGFADAFLTKINMTESGAASLVYSTYLGGRSYERGTGIAVHASGNAYLTGETWSPDFPTTANALKSTLGGREDAFLIRVDTSRSGAASLVYSSYLGGSSDDGGFDIAVDASGYAYVTGRTLSEDFPTTANAFQSTFAGGSDAFVTKSYAFVTKVDTSRSGAASLLYSTYLGSSSDFGDGIAVDASGNTYITGAGDGDAFVTKVDTTKSGAASLGYSAYLGGNDLDIGRAIAVDASGNPYITGDTFSTNFPTTPSALQSSGTGGRNAFVAKLSIPEVVTVLYFPLLDSDSEVDTGFALANVSSTSVTALVEGFTDAGKFQVPLEIGPLKQVSKLTREIFPNPSSGWFRVSHSGPAGSLKGFFLHGRLNDLSTIDGTDAVERLATDLLFPAVGPSPSVVTLVNPNLEAANLTLEYLPPGSSDPTSISLCSLCRTETTVPAGSALRVRSDLGLFGLQTLPERKSRQDFVMVRGLDVATESGTELFFAHMAEGSGYETLLTLINLSPSQASASVQVKIVLDTGITELVNRILPPNGVLQTRLRELFSSISGQRVNVGYIKATSDQPLLGSITFKHNLKGATAALPGQGTAFTRLVFSHVAMQDVSVTNNAWLTGIALLNPGANDATVKLTVRKPDGSEAGVRDNFLLKAGQRISRLLVELVREVKNQAGGYILVESSQPLYGFELFGDWFLKKLAAVPAQTPSVVTETTTVSVSSREAWTDTGLSVSAGDSVSITASGTITFDSAGRSSGPDGLTGRDASVCNFLVTDPAIPQNSLVGNIADSASFDGKGFFVGLNFQGRVPISNTTKETGKLFLGFNDGFVRCDRSGLDSGGVGDNSGSFTATITITRTR